MNITSAKYHAWAENEGDTPINVSVTIVVDGKTMSVPLDPANRHYQAIQEWVDEGNTIQEAD